MGLSTQEEKFDIKEGLKLISITFVTVTSLLQDAN